MRHLGERSPFPERYAPELLEAIPRNRAREQLGIVSPLPFDGEDIWNAYEVTWLNDKGAAETGMLRFAVPATSPALVESKSVKLYLGGLTFESFSSVAVLEEVIRKDLTASVAAPVTIHVDLVEAYSPLWVPVTNIPDASNCTTISSHALRSLCPVTGQPDHGTCIVRSQGVEIPLLWLEELLKQHRDQEGFHEECCERIFCAAIKEFAVSALSVGCFYTRRGGIDINPIRRTPSLIAEDPAYLSYFRTIRQ